MLSAPKKDYTKALWSVRKLAKAEAPANEDLLRIENVTAAYGHAVKVLEEVTVYVPRGRTVAVVGESGSGKSTLARVITGLLPARCGSISFGGRVIANRLSDRAKELRRKIQMIYQMPDEALNPRQTVEEVIGRPLEFYFGIKGAARRARVIELLDTVEMNEGVLHRRPGELSGGQKQRICIARALAAGPELIICDEITSALDQVVQAQILKLLVRLQRERAISYVFITHDIATVRAIADQVVVLCRGKVVEQGLKTEILTPPHAPYTELLLSSVPEMDPHWLTDLLARRKRDAALQAGIEPI
jgi:peptide/nickel transport system ATP-binding protein